MGQIAVGTLRARTLVVHIGGSGSVQATGTVDGQQVDIAGAGSYRASELACRAAMVTINGIGDVQVQPRDRLDVTINGGVPSATWATPPCIRPSRAAAACARPLAAWAGAPRLRVRDRRAASAKGKEGYRRGKRGRMARDTRSSSAYGGLGSRGARLPAKGAREGCRWIPI